MKLRLIGGWSCEGPLAFITGQAQLASPVTTLTFAPDLTFEAQAFPFPVRRKSWERPFLHTPLRGVWRGRLWHARIQRRGMPFSATVGPNPRRAVKESHCQRLHLDRGSNLSIVPESLPAHIPDWINSTAAWGFGPSALEGVGRCVAATSDDCSSRGQGDRMNEATTCLILPLSQHYLRHCIPSLAFRQ